MKRNFAMNAAIILVGSLLACSQVMVIPTPTKSLERWQTLGKYEVRSVNLNEETAWSGGLPAS